MLLTVDLERLDVQPGHLVLDAGCGEGRHCFGCVGRGARAVGFDLDFESHLEDLAPHEIDDPRTRADVFLAELDAWAPHHLGPLGRAGTELRLDLGLDPRDVARLDYLAVW